MNISLKQFRSVVEFSLLRCKDFVAQQSHQDVDVEPNHIWEHQWDQFLTDFYLVTILIEFNL